jgi:histidinol phosphatase-like PHP family hydrolase
VIVDHDLHVHTFLSACSGDEAATPGNIIARAAEVGLRTIGFADHMWDSRVPGASDWYRPQSYEHLSQIRQQIPGDTHGVRVLVGCETEYCGDGKVGISREAAEQLDFVLIPMSHTHMNGFVKPSGVESTKDVASLLVTRFNEVVDLGLATGIAHPFLPGGYAQATDEILSLIPDSQFLDCFGRAAERRIGQEITIGFFPALGGGELPGFHDESFLRVLSLAKRAGCAFHFASDTHTLAGVGRSLALEPYARAIGLSTDDILPLARAGN